MSGDATEHQTLKDVLKMVWARCDSMHDFDSDRGNISKEFLKRAMEKNKYLSQDVVKSLLIETLEKQGTSLSTFDVDTYINRLFDKKSISDANKQQKDGISDKSSYEMSVIRFVEKCMKNDERFSPMFLEFSTIFQDSMSMIDLTPILKKKKKGAQYINDVDTVVERPNQMIVRLGVETDRMYNRTHDDSQTLGRLIHSFFKRYDIEDNPNIHEKIFLIIDSTFYDVANCVLEDREGEQMVTTMKMYSSRYDANKRKKTEHVSMHWNPRFIVQQPNSIYELDEIEFSIKEETAKENGGRKKKKIFEGIDENNFKVELKYDQNNVKQTVDISKVTPSVKTLSEIMTDVDKKFPETLKWDCSCKQEDMINILLDLKRVGDGSQIIEGVYANATTATDTTPSTSSSISKETTKLSPRKKAFYDTFVFVTQDHLACLYARLNNIPVIFNKRRNVGGVVYTEFWFIRPSEYDAFLLQYDGTTKENVEVKKQRNTLTNCELIFAIYTKVCHINRCFVDMTQKHHIDDIGEVLKHTKDSVKTLYDTMKQIIGQHNFMEKLRIYWSRNKHQNVMVFETITYISQYMSDLIDIHTQLSVLEVLQKITDKYAKEYLSCDETHSIDTLKKMYKGRMHDLLAQAFAHLKNYFDDGGNINKRTETTLAKLTDLEQFIEDTKLDVLINPDCAKYLTSINDYITTNFIESFDTRKFIKDVLDTSFFLKFSNYRLHEVFTQSYDSLRHEFLSASRNLPSDMTFQQLVDMREPRIVKSIGAFREIVRKFGRLMPQVKFSDRIGDRQAYADVVLEKRVDAFYNYLMGQFYPNYKLHERDIITYAEDFNGRMKNHFDLLNHYYINDVGLFVSNMLGKTRGGGDPPKRTRAVSDMTRYQNNQDLDALNSGNTRNTKRTRAIDYKQSTNTLVPVHVGPTTNKPHTSNQPNSMQISVNQKESKPPTSIEGSKTEVGDNMMSDQGSVMQPKSITSVNQESNKTTVDSSSIRQLTAVQKAFNMNISETLVDMVVWTSRYNKDVLDELNVFITKGYDLDERENVIYQYKPKSLRGGRGSAIVNMMNENVAHLVVFLVITMIFVLFNIFCVWMYEKDPLRSHRNATFYITMNTALFAFLLLVFHQDIEKTLTVCVVYVCFVYIHMMKVLKKPNTTQNIIVKNKV